MEHLYYKYSQIEFQRVYARIFRFSLQKRKKYQITSKKRKEKMHRKIEFPLKWNFVGADYVNFVLSYYLKMFYVDQKVIKSFIF